MNKREKLIVNNYTILIADDDADDRLMAREAFCENFSNAIVQFVHDGEELMDYLKENVGNYFKIQNNKSQLILLDLNMPKKDGKEALVEIKQNKDFKEISAIIFSTSRSDDDILKTYDLEVNCYIAKPNTYSELLELAKKIGDYWFKTVELPFVA